jgi:hypothetical protein
VRTRERICRKKARYADRAEAEAAARTFGLLLLPYHCERCGFVHLTSRTRGKRLPRDGAKAPARPAGTD